MKIAIDLQSCQSGSRLGGIGRYSVELAKAMVRRPSGHSFTIVLSDADPVGAAHARAAFSDLLPPDAIRSFAIPRGVSELTNHGSKVRSAELIREQFLTELAPDQVHVSSLFEGLQEDIVTSVGQIFRAERTAVTLYDLIPLVQRDRYLANQRALEHYLGKVEQLRRAGLLLAISEFSRREACELLKIDPSNVVNISSAADARFRPVTLDPRVAEDLKRRYGIEKRFLMYTGSFDQRKNHAALIRAFALLPATTRKQFQLLIVGNGWDAVYQQLRAVAKQVGLAEGHLVFAGHVADADLVPLYNLCDLFVFPSLAEGFGLPVLEAMSCGVPTVCSNTTSLPEVIGMKDAMFDPTAPKSIAATLNRALTDENFRQRLRSNGLERSRQFSWDESARRAIEAFEARQDLLARASSVTVSAQTSQPLDALPAKLKAVPEIDKVPDAALRDFSRCLALNHITLDAAASIDRGEKSADTVGWISTWNTRCGIAAYSRFLVEQWPSRVAIFAPYADWTTQEDESNVARCWESGGADDLELLYQQVFAAGLDTVVIQFNYSFFDFEALSRFIDRLAQGGTKVFVTFHSTHDPAPSKRLADISRSLARCAGLIVHTLRDVLTLERLGLRENVTLLPQGVPDFEPPQATQTVDSKAVTIATYGFALPNKGLIQVLEALPILRRRSSVAFRLLMVNAEYPDPQSGATLHALRQAIANAGLGDDDVTLVADYLPDDKSIELLQRADVVVFAYQSTGESSSAAVRMGLASGRPVAVTPLHIFEDVKDCTFALPGIGPDDIAAGLLLILEQLRGRASGADEVRLNAQRWRKAHSFAKIAKELFLLTNQPMRSTIHYEIKPDYELSAKRGGLRYSATQPPLKSSVGEVRDGRLVTTERSGHLLYGPFISAASGSYRAVLSGRVAGKGHALLDVCAKSGNAILAETRLPTSDEPVSLPDIVFSVPEGGVNDLEVRLLVDEDICIELDGLQFEPVNQGPQPSAART